MLKLVQIIDQIGRETKIKTTPSSLTKEQLCQKLKRQFPRVPHGAWLDLHRKNEVTVDAANGKITYRILEV